MAIRAKLIGRLRRKMGDWKDPNCATDTTVEVYADAYYEDALDDALARLDADTASTYSIATLPASWEWALLLIAQIELIKVRIIDSAESNGAPAGSGEPGQLQRIQVPGYEAWFHTPRGATGSDWVKLLKQLQDEYQKWLDDNGLLDQVENDLPVATCYTMQREEARRGRAWRNFTTDKGITPPSDLVATEDVDGIVLTWTQTYHPQFRCYAIDRRTSDIDWYDDNVVLLDYIYDNHIERYVDDTLTGPDTYVYRIRVINKNSISTVDGEAEIIVA